MPWIESHTVLLRHRKLVAFAKDLRTRKSYAMGHLHGLWHAALEQQEDGVLSFWNDDMIADAADYPGDAPQFVALLRKHKWLDGDLKIHDWWQYAGPYLRAKYKKSPEKWMRIRDIYGNPSVTVTSPDTKPTKPTTTPTDRELEDRKQQQQLKALIASTAESKSAVLREEKLLSMPMPFGERQGANIRELDADYCANVLERCGQRIGPELKAALYLRIRLKSEECAR